ncbi:MAG: SRPBCC domain-containing protein [Bacteroidia bacterium]|jgi:uncharacterized protein YndB with AHSA1/START domain
MKIKVEVVVNASLEEAWRRFTQPEHIVNWNAASADWHCPAARNELKAGGTFSYRMEARDGSMGFDFSGKFIAVEPLKHLSILLDDKRSLEVWFEAQADGVRITEEFEAEQENEPELQRMGWQAILDAYARYCENYST